jgi:phosphomannomutase
MSVFKACDIRGVYPDEIHEELAYTVGRALVTFLRCKNVVVGYDMRESSASLFSSLTRGITDQGADAVTIGMCTTPMLNFSVAHYTFDAGIMISASHNPGKYNGFKLIKAPALQISSTSGMQEIETLATGNAFEEPETKGTVSKMDVLKDYTTHIVSKFPDIKKVKVVVDYSNGMGAISAVPVFEQLDIEVIHLYPEPDPTFPHHEANPHELKNFADLQKAVLREHADAGIFFDGDADRSLIVDEKGKIVFPDILFCLVMEHELKDHPGEKVYYDLRFTKAAEDIIKRNKGVPVMMRVGNPFYKEKLIHEGGLAASEFSGHAMFNENYAIDDGLFAALKVISIISNSDETLSEMVNPFVKYHTTPEINIPVAGMDPDEILDRVADRFKDGERIELDGVYIQYAAWWFSLRKSNTESLVRLRIEADTEELMNKKKKEILEAIDVGSANT